MSDIDIKVRLFGAFRKYGEELSFSVPAGSPLLVVRRKLENLVSAADKALVQSAAFADDDSILGEDAVITSDARLAVLPPVCGG